MEIRNITKWIVDGSGTLMLQAQSNGIPYLGEEVARAVMEISSFRQQEALHLMVNKMPPGIQVPKHRDWLKPSKQGERPTVERWHLPVQTNERCGWWDEKNGDMHLEYGYWWGPMPYWTRHAVSNLSNFERIHLIIDLDTPRSLGIYED